MPTAPASYGQIISSSLSIVMSKTGSNSKGIFTMHLRILSHRSGTHKDVARYLCRHRVHLHTYIRPDKTIIISSVFRQFVPSTTPEACSPSWCRYLHFGPAPLVAPAPVAPAAAAATLSPPSSAEYAAGRVWRRGAML